MTAITFFIILIHVILCYSNVCEKDPQKEESQVLDTFRWKQMNKSANFFNVSVENQAQEKTRHRNWFDAGLNYDISNSYVNEDRLNPCTVLVTQILFTIPWIEVLFCLCEYLVQEKLSTHIQSTPGIIPKDIISGSLGIISKGIQFLAPTFIFSSDVIRNEHCKNDYDTYLKELSELKLWALKMYDSSGKLSSGLLNGNVNQFGDFDLCLSIDNHIRNIKGKYCLIYFQIKLNEKVHGNIKEIFDLVHSHNAFRSEISDPGHRIPRFSTINWALCIPNSCSHEEVEHQLKRFIRTNSDHFHFDVQVKVDEEMCHMKKSSELSNSFIAVSTFLICIIAVVLISTVKDVIFDDSGANPSLRMNFLDCFSLKRNVKQLSSTDREPDDISSIHGIRMINAMLLLLSHRSMAIFFYPYINRTNFVERVSQPWTIIARIASLYTDAFIMISGTLTSYSFCNKLKKNGSLDIKSEYLNRLIRILPLLILTVLLSTFILPELGSGPQWGLTVSHHSNSCKSSWWKNFLFIHNYFGFENMCLTHTHHIGIDTQLFITSPFLVYMLHKWQLLGACFLIAIAAVSTGLRYYLTVDKSLSYFIYPGISVSQMIDTANYSYIIPSHRMTVYIIGIITGYILRNVKKNQIKNSIIRIGWMVALSLFCCVISKSVSMSYIEYVYNKHEAANYSALAPIAWCLFLGWIIFSSHINPGGVIERILSSKFCQVWTRISYAVYLIQFPVFFYNVGGQRYPKEFSLLCLVNVYEYFSVITASVILTLFIDMPSNNIRRLIRQISIHAKKNSEKL